MRRGQIGQPAASIRANTTEFQMIGMNAATLARRWPAGQDKPKAVAARRTRAALLYCRAMRHPAFPFRTRHAAALLPATQIRRPLTP